MEKGRKVCNELKAIRKSIADANGIEYTPNECNHKGECAGTCPACEAEVRYLEKQLSMKAMLGKAVVVAGLSLGVASCVGCGAFQTQGEMAPANNVDSAELIRGKVPAPTEVEALAGDVPALVDDSLATDTTAACQKGETAPGSSKTK